MKTDSDKSKTVAEAESEATLAAPSGSACRVWLVRELVDRCELPKREDAQDCFVLAVTAIEAAGIVGEDERRRIIRVEEVCPISKLPDDKYKVVACTPNRDYTK